MFLYLCLHAEDLVCDNVHIVNNLKNAATDTVFGWNFNDLDYGTWNLGHIVVWDKRAQAKWSKYYIVDFKYGKIPLVMCVLRIGIITSGHE